MCNLDFRPDYQANGELEYRENPNAYAPESPSLEKLAVQLTNARCNSEDRLEADESISYTTGILQFGFAAIFAAKVFAL